MSELITPYYTESVLFADDGAGLAHIHDKNGFWIASCFTQDAEEILTRINQYEQLQKTNQELLEALEMFVNNNTVQANHPMTCELAEEAINNAKQVIKQK